MNRVKPLVLKVTDLPIAVVVYEGNGKDVAVYQLAPASRKLGASLQKLEGSVKESVLRDLQRN